MANCHKCGKTKIKKNKQGVFSCKRCGIIRKILTAVLEKDVK